MTVPKMPRVAIIGGGYSGVLSAIQLSRQSGRPLDITIVEPQTDLGRGVAYAARDRDHRLNAPTGIHLLYLDDPDHFTRWHTDNGALANDPDAGPAGGAYSRRYDFGTYLGQELAKHASDNPSNSEIVHRQTAARDITTEDDKFSITFGDGTSGEFEFLIVTTSNAPPVVPGPLRAIATDNPALIANPWNLDKFQAIPDDAEILLVGTGLTMSDVVATLTRDRPDAQITAISRRGLLPTSRPASPPEGSMVESLTRPVPLFVERHGAPKTVREVLKVLRDNARQREASGSHWQFAFDEMRDAAHVLWPGLPPEEQARFVRHLWPWYEVHRFRFPPQTEKWLRKALSSEHLTVAAARLITARESGNRIEAELQPRGAATSNQLMFDTVINCTGPERKPREAGDPFLKNLVSAGLVMPHALGLGVEADASCRAIDNRGDANPRLRIVGPLSRGRFGEVNGVPHIVARLNTAMPDILSTLNGI